MLPNSDLNVPPRKNKGIEGMISHPKLDKWFPLFLLFISVGCAALAMGWFKNIGGWAVPMTSKFIIGYWVACFLCLIYAITVFLESKTFHARHLIIGFLCLAIGLYCAALATGKVKNIFANIPAPRNPELVIAYWDACFFFLIYGIIWLFRPEILSGTLHLLVAVTLLVESTIWAIFIVGLWTSPAYLLQIQAGLLHGLLALLPFSLYVSFLAVKRQPLLDELKLNLSRIYREQEKSYSEVLKLYEQKFNNMFGSNNSLPGFEALLPIILTTMLMSLGWLYTASNIYPYIWGIITKKPQSIVLDPVNYGFIGAYLFSVSFLFRRYVQSDLGPVAYTNVNIRLITTFLWAMLLWNLEEATIVNVLAFAVGIFPDVGWQWLLKRLQSIAGSSTPDQSKNYPLSQISGITIWVENRLLEEDIENVQNLATANLAELLLQTNYPTGRLIDWIDQAILQVHLFACKKKPEDNPAVVADDLGLKGITTASAFLAYCDKNQPKDDSGLLARLVNELKNEANLYHIKVWHSAYQSQLPEPLGMWESNSPVAVYGSSYDLQ